MGIRHPIASANWIEYAGAGGVIEGAESQAITRIDMVAEQIATMRIRATRP
jgi:hypothetical protein